MAINLAPNAIIAPSLKINAPSEYCLYLSIVQSSLGAKISYYIFLAMCKHYG